MIKTPQFILCVIAKVSKLEPVFLLSIAPIQSEASSILDAFNFLVRTHPLQFDIKQVEQWKRKGVFVVQNGGEEHFKSISNSRVTCGSCFSRYNYIELINPIIMMSEFGISFYLEFNILHSYRKMWYTSCGTREKKNTINQLNAIHWKSFHQPAIQLRYSSCFISFHSQCFLWRFSCVLLLCVCYQESVHCRLKNMAHQTRKSEQKKKNRTGME